jgi:hypothetical protein
MGTGIDCCKFAPLALLLVVPVALEFTLALGNGLMGRLEVVRWIGALPSTVLVVAPAEDGLFCWPGTLEDEIGRTDVFVEGVVLGGVVCPPVAVPEFPGGVVAAGVLGVCRNPRTR